MQAMVIAENKEDRDFIGFVIRHTGLAVATSMDSKRVVPTFTERPVDLILLSSANADSSLKTIEDLRKVAQQTPLILLIERLTEDQHCALLDAGADLVLERPFSPRILSRYVRMLLRRVGTVPATVLSSIETGGIVLDPTTRTVTVPEQPAQRLTQLEFRLLYLLMTNSGQVLPTDEIVERVWGYGGEGNRDLVRGLVRRLRRKIEPNPKTPLYIHNLPGVGYHFLPPSA